MKFSLPPFPAPIFFKLALWVLVILGCLTIAMPFVEDSPMKIAVMPTNKTALNDSAIATINGNNIWVRGLLEISKPTSLERAVLQEHDGDSFFQIICIIICSMICLQILAKTKNGDVLSVDIGKQIIFIGLVVLLYFFTEKFQLKLVADLVLKQTNGQFAMLPQNPGFIPTSCIAAIIIALGIFLKKAYSLKQEQDLTI